MSSLELNKIAGAVLVGGLVALTSGILADRLVRPHGPEQVAVALPEGEAATTAAPEAEAAPQAIGPLLASADPAAGQQVARRCASCHTFEQGGANRVGPNLWDIVGVPFAHVEGFPYSEAIAGREGVWTYEDLDAFIASPRAYAPGTKMSFAGIRDAQDRANLIAYLRTLSDSPEPLPEPTAAAPAESAPATEEPAPTESPPAEPQEGAASEPAGGAAGEAAAGAVALLAEADPANGERLARRCVACHSFEQGGPNKVGPNLWDIVGAPHAHMENYNYSPALAGLADRIWDYAALDAYLESPRDYAPGTKMTFAGLRKPEERADLIAYLRTLSESPEPLP